MRTFEVDFTTFRRRRYIIPIKAEDEETAEAVVRARYDRGVYEFTNADSDPWPIEFFEELEVDSIEEVLDAEKD